MKPTIADLKKSNELFYFQDPTLIPVTYKIGDKKYYGIPKEFNPKVTRRIIDANIVFLCRLCKKLRLFSNEYCAFLTKKQSSIVLYLCPIVSLY